MTPCRLQHQLYFRFVYPLLMFNVYVKLYFLLIESHSDSDHERVWEEQQIKKGVSIPAQQVRRFVIYDFLIKLLKRSGSGNSPLLIFNYIL